MNKRKINVITICSGYDSQMLACRRIQKAHPEIEFDLIAWAEIDKYAIQAHNALFPEYSERNVGDITQVDWSQFADIEGGIDLLFASTPCTNVSLAGKGAGAEKDSGTASSLLWETERVIKVLHPKVMIGENVKGLISKKHLPVYKEWLKMLESYGYRNYFQILNATDYNVPQNRERVFTISIRDSQIPYVFPQPILMINTLDRIIEAPGTVPEEYYLSQKHVEAVLSHCNPLKVKEAIKTIKEMMGDEDTGGVIPCAIRGRGEGADYSQNLELQGADYANCLTTVEKDSLLLEIQKNGSYNDKEMEDNNRSH